MANDRDLIDKAQRMQQQLVAHRAVSEALRAQAAVLHNDIAELQRRAADALQTSQRICRR